LLIRKCRQHIKTRQTCEDNSLSYGLDVRAVGHPPCIAGPSRLFPPVIARRTIAPSLRHSGALQIGLLLLLLLLLLNVGAVANK